MERVSKNITVEQVKKLDAEGKIKRKLSKAPLKDTVTVPDGGYTIIRWYADNPGNKQILTFFNNKFDRQIICIMCLIYRILAVSLSY